MTANNLNSLADAKEKVRAFVLEYAADRGVTEVKDDEPLLTTNIIDSLGSFRMIAFLEETFPLTIEDTDMVPENFQTLNDVEIFIANKLGNGANGSSDAAPIAAPEVPELVNALRISPYKPLPVATGAGSTTPSSGSGHIARRHLILHCAG